MRYVIGVCIVTGMIVADGAYYDGRYLDHILRVANGLVQSAMNLVH